MHVTTDQPQLATSSGLHEHSQTTLLLKFFIFGHIFQLAYSIYISAFTLISNTQAGGPAPDLGILMGDQRWFAPVDTAGLLLFYFLFWRMMKLAFATDSLYSGTSYIFLGKWLGLLPQSYYWPIMHPLTVSRSFNRSLFGPTLMKWARSGDLSVRAVTSRRAG